MAVKSAVKMINMGGWYVCTSASGREWIASRIRANNEWAIDADDGNDAEVAENYTPGMKAADLRKWLEKN